MHLFVYNNWGSLLHALLPIDMPRQHFGTIMLFVIRARSIGPIPPDKDSDSAIS